MLVRTQVLFKDTQRQQAEELAMLQGISMSEIHRRIFDDGIVNQKRIAKKKVQKKMNGAEFLLDLAKHAVKGPGDSEYDKYAYDY